MLVVSILVLVVPTKNARNTRLIREKKIPNDLCLIYEAVAVNTPSDFTSKSRKLSAKKNMNPDESKWNECTVS